MAYEPLIGQARLAKRMRKEIQCDPQWVLDLAAERDQVRAEVEAMKKDAERYRWLMRSIGGSIAYTLLGTCLYREKEVATAIDAAMAAKEGACASN